MYVCKYDCIWYVDVHTNINPMWQMKVYADVSILMVKILYVNIMIVF